MFAPALHSPFAWVCFLLGLDFGSWEISIVCRSDVMQAYGKPDLPSPGLASFMLHALGKAEPALLDLIQPSRLLHFPSLASILFLAQLQCCFQHSSGHKVLLSVGGCLLWSEQRHFRMMTHASHDMVFCSPFYHIIVKMRHFSVVQKYCGVCHKGSFGRCWWKAGDLQDISCAFVPMSNCW